MPDHDVLIVGAGPVGGVLALALLASGLRTAILETRPPQAARTDPRPLALSHGSRLLLERLGVWEDLDPVTAIERIHVSQRGGFGRVTFEAVDIGLPALGYVLDYGTLAAAMAAALRRDCECVAEVTIEGLHAHGDAGEVEFRTGAGPRRAGARLVVLADGGMAAAGGEPRRIDYQQAAVAARVAASVPHQHVAYERFTREGPLALLPAADGMALVWVMTPERAQRLCIAPEADFLNELQQAFGERLGDFTSVAQRAAFPLALTTARDAAGARIVRVGNAAQSLHPVGGQGLNLGLRDAWELAHEIQRCPPHDLGAPAFLRRHAARRRLDRRAGIWLTHGLAQIFCSELLPVRLARGFGLAALAAVPPARDFLARRMIFGARG
jgi:2-octaprenyl-6-methoxyphenol hydroxylase